jgi:hypothetical protein
MLALGSEAARAALTALATDSPIFSPMIEACMTVSFLNLISFRPAVMASVMASVSTALAMASVLMALVMALAATASTCSLSLQRDSLRWPSILCLFEFVYQLMCEE